MNAQNSPGTPQNNVIPEGFKIINIGLTPDDWNLLKLDEFIEQIKDSVDPSTTNIQKYVGLKHMDSGNCQIRRWGNPSDVRSTKYAFQPSNVLYGKLRPYLDKVVYAEFDGICSTDIIVLKAKNNANNIFISYLLHHPLVLNHAIATTTGVNHPRTSWKKLSKLKILLPPLPEQRNIAQVLSTIQTAREKTKSVIQATKELKKSMMKHLFTYGPIPPSKAGSVPLKETEIGMVPEGGDVVRLGDVIKGTQYGISMRGNPEGDYPILRMNNLIDGRIETLDLQYVDLDDDAFEKFRVNPGDILFNRTNSFELVGKTSLFNIRDVFVFASYLVRAVPDITKLSPEYINYYLNWDSTQNRLKFLATRGVSQSNINATKLRNFIVSVPSLPTQQKIVSILTSIDEKLRSEENKKKALDEMFKTMLNNLMTGKIRVNDLEVDT